MLNTELVPSNIFYKFFKTWNLPTQYSYCDHRNFDSVNQPLLYEILAYIVAVRMLFPPLNRK